MNYFDALELTTAKYTANLVDSDGAAIALADITTLTLTLYDVGTVEETGAGIINSRDSQDVLNKEGVTVSAAGALTWIMSPADNPIVTDTNRGEKHIALFTWTYSSGRTGRHEVAIIVQNLTKVS